MVLGRWAALLKTRLNIKSRTGAIHSISANTCWHCLAADCGPRNICSPAQLLSFFNIAGQDQSRSRRETKDENKILELGSTNKRLNS